MPATSCCRSHAVTVMAIMLASCSSRSAWGDQVIRLGGVRNVTATVSALDDTYRIAIEMLPVKAFDPATNKALNLSKGRMYAAQALGKHLKAGNLAIRGLEIRESGTKGNTFQMVAVVPRDGVSVTAKGTPTAQVQHVGTGTLTRSPAEASTSIRHEIHLAADATTADFLNRKADYLDTIARLPEALSEEADSLERQPLKPEDFYDSIGSVEERTEAAFKAITGQIGGDKLLVSVEQEELLPALKKAHAEALESLKTAVSRFDQRQEKKNTTQ